MKANQAQYEIATELYRTSKEPVASVFDYANKIGVDEWSFCAPCEQETPDCKGNGDTSCLVCGSAKNNGGNHNVR